jgi:hypothetical protein
VRVSFLAATAAMVVLLTAGCGSGGALSGGAAGSACKAAFDAAAAVDPMQDSVADLYPAIRACSLADWRTEFTAHGGAGFTGTPDEVLRNACQSAEVASTALCQRVQ